MRSRFLLTVSVSAVLAGFGLTACGSDDSADPPKAAGSATVSAAPTTGRSTTPTSDPSASSISSPSGAASDPTGSSSAKCRATELKWTLTRLGSGGGDGTADAPNAELVAVNSGSRSCILAGYPKLEFHQGKGPQATGVGKGSPAAVTLGPGKGAVIALRYSEMNGKGPDSGNCNPLVTASAAEVTAPGGGAAVRVLVVDQGGKPAEVTVCGQEVRMSPPLAR